MLPGVTNSNGLAWSPDGGTLYYVDTGRGTIDCMDVDPSSGAVANRRPHVTVPVAEGLPGRPDDRRRGLPLARALGRLVCAPLLALGCARPSGRPARRAGDEHGFGGAALDKLFITTAREGLTLAERGRQPLAGSVFRHRPGVAGLPPAAFAG